MDGLPAPRYIMSIIVSSYQHCDEQQFHTLSCALYTILSVIKLDLVIQALFLYYILTLEKNTRTPRVHLVLNIEINILKHFKDKIYNKGTSVS